MTRKTGSGAAHASRPLTCGTLYNLLESFQAAGWIMETKTEGRRRSYLITPAGEQALAEEYRRLQKLAEDYRNYMGRRGEIES